ncbi:MAG TPA: hypothetical protein VMF11_05340 [Candidatus Baltobacteraceae bacterium]|nr:hypothetical protein [Candidatus Baltobacteraceae bacterium]
MMRPLSELRIGLDLDNTLISYDQLFQRVALERGLIPPGFTGTKRDIRDAIRLLPGGEVQWQRLQAEVYGPAIGGAVAAEGALDFIRMARRGGAELSIVSHKTAVSNLGSEKVNLHDAARSWLYASGMLGARGVPEEHLYFEGTRAEKIARIIQLQCTHFIDDLEEVFDDPAFPANVERMLLSTAAAVPRGRYRAYASFRDIAHAFLAD